MKTVFQKSLIATAPLLLVALLAACGSGSGSGTTTTTPVNTTPACQTNNTANIRFQNQSATNLTYNVVWDGSTITSLAPGASSQYYAVTAGVTHTLQFMKANGGAACTMSYPILTQCSSYTYWCST